MSKSEEMRERLRRANAYPYEIPAASFLQLGAQTLELPADLDLSGREPLLAYGSNAAPEALARKLAALPDLPLPLVRAELEDFDVVYSAHISPHGAIPATLQRSPGTTVAVFVAYPTAAQLRLLSTTEPNYELRRLAGIRCRLAPGGELTEVDAYLSRHGCLAVNGSEFAFAAVAAAQRRFAQIDQLEVQELARNRLAPGLSPEQFIAGSLDAELIQRRTAILAATAKPLVLA